MIFQSCYERIDLFLLIYLEYVQIANFMPTELQTWGSDSDGNEEDENEKEMHSALKRAALRQLDSHITDPIEPIGDPEECVSFNVELSKERTLLRLRMLVVIKHQYQQIQYGSGQILAHQNAKFIVENDIVERVIADLPPTGGLGTNDPMREFFVSRYFDPGIAEIIDLVEADDDTDKWEVRTRVLEMADELRERLLHCSADDYRSFSGLAAKSHNDSAQSANIPHRPTVEKCQDALCTLAGIVYAYLASLNVSYAQEFGKYRDGTMLFLRARLKKDGTLDLLFSTRRERAAMIGDLVREDKYVLYGVHPAVTAKCLNAMHVDAETREMRQVIADQMFHQLFDQIQNGQLDHLSVAMIRKFCAQITIGSLPANETQPFDLEDRQE